MRNHFVLACVLLFPTACGSDNGSSGTSDGGSDVTADGGLAADGAHDLGASGDSLGQSMADSDATALDTGLIGDTAAQTAGDTVESPDGVLANPGSQSAVVSTQISGPACDVSREVEVGVWGNGGACTGDPAFILTVDLSYTCFGWERSLPDGTTRWNSATNFRCYKDRVCYTQHPATGTCEAPIGTTDKEWRADTCSAGTMILSGTADCPEAPAEGCPSSAKQQGSQDLTCDAP